jgi:hypothetical protein
MGRAVNSRAIACFKRREQAMVNYALRVKREQKRKERLARLGLPEDWKGGRRRR